MTTHPDLEVCVIFFNKAEQTIECLASLRDARVSTVVLDNGSAPAARDAVLRATAAFERVRFVDAGENLGCARGRNRLLAETNAPWLLFVDNDITIVTPDWLERFRAHARKQPDAEVLAPQMYNVHHGSYQTHFNVVFGDTRAWLEPSDDAELTNLFPGGASFIRRSLFDRLGHYDAEMEGFEDWDLAFGAARAGDPVRCRWIADIELRHEHRRAQAMEDRDSVWIRYPEDGPARLRARILERHGVVFDAERRWEEAHARHRNFILGDGGG